MTRVIGTSYYKSFSATLFLQGNKIVQHRIFSKNIILNGNYTWHTTYRQNNNHEKCADIGLNCFIFKKKKKYYIDEKKKISWEPVRICLLSSTANLAQFGWKLAGLAVLFSRQILNSSQDLFFSLIQYFLFKCETIVI